MSLIVSFATAAQTWHPLGPGMPSLAPPLKVYYDDDIVVLCWHLPRYGGSLDPCSHHCMDNQIVILTDPAV